MSIRAERGMGRKIVEKRMLVKLLRMSPRLLVYFRFIRICLLVSLLCQLRPPVPTVLTNGSRRDLRGVLLPRQCLRRGYAQGPTSSTATITRNATSNAIECSLTNGLPLVKMEMKTVNMTRARKPLTKGFFQNLADFHCFRSTMN